MGVEQFGPYRLEALLGRGGMGEVHRAFDTVRERTVALKRLHPSLATDPTFRERFRRESRLAARIASPHVIPIHDFGEIDGRLFLDMRLADGADLDTVVTRDGPLAPARAVALVGQVADALAAAHAAGLVHRDVKPSNILVTGPRDAEFAYLVDFGIVRALDGGVSLTGTGAAIGTLAYMAPEILEGADADERSDVYALACVLVETLLGRPPFPAAGVAALMYAHLSTPPPRPSDHGLPASLDAVVARGMAKDPRDRHDGPRELARDAAAALARPGATGAGAPSAPVDAPAPRRPQSVTPTAVPGAPAAAPRRRRRRVLLAAGATALVAVLGTTWVVGATTSDPGALAYPVAEEVATSGSPTLVAMTQRGRLRLGVREHPTSSQASRPGFDTALGAFDLEIGRMLAAGLGFGPDEVDVRPVSLVEGEGAIVPGTVDLTTGGYYRPRSRTSSTSSAGPYLETAQTLLARGDDPSIAGTTSTAGKRVCAVARSTAAIGFRTETALTSTAATGSPVLVERNDLVQCVDDLLAKRVDAVTGDLGLLVSAAAAYPGRVRTTGTLFGTFDGYGVDLARDDSVLRARVNDLLQAAIDDGTWQRIYDATLGASGQRLGSPQVLRY